MSAERSSSAVRNLRSIFESKESESASTPGPRARSESTEPGREGRRPLSKVRSSFVAVDSSRVMEEPTKSDTIVEQEGDEQPTSATRTTSASLRRPSFSANTDDSEELGLKKVITHESERRGRDESVPEVIPEAAVESTPGTPLAQAADVRASLFTKNDSLKASNLSDETSSTNPQPPTNPDKPVTGAEEDAGPLKPADLTSKAEISEKPASVKTTLPDRSKPAPAVEQPRPAAPEPVKKESQAAPIVKAVPAKQISTSKPQPSTESKAVAERVPVANGSNQASSATASKPTAKALNRKASRSSLAASKASASSRTEHPDLPAKPKPRETTKPLDISSHLLATTAASRARHDADELASTTSKDTNRNVRASIGSNSNASTRATPRTSLARQSRPGSRTSQTSAATRKPPVPVPDGSFLERMMRPTAASQNRAQEKFESRAPAKKTAPPPARKPAAAAAARPKAASPQAQAGAQGASSLTPPHAEEQTATPAETQAPDHPATSTTETS